MSETETCTIYESLCPPGFDLLHADDVAFWGRGALARGRGNVNAKMAANDRHRVLRVNLWALASADGLDSGGFEVTVELLKADSFTVPVEIGKNLLCCHASRY
jgi:hypothetical protein